MKKKRATFALLSCFLLILCLSVSAQDLKSSKVLNYSGESEHWLATFTIEFSGGVITKVGKIKYKGEDVNSVGQVTCSYETIAGKLTSISLLAGVSPDSPIGEKGTLSSKGVGGNNDLYSKVDVIKVTVEWNGKTESFNLYK